MKISKYLLTGLIAITISSYSYPQKDFSDIALDDQGTTFGRMLDYMPPNNPIDMIFHFVDNGEVESLQNAIQLGVPVVIFDSFGATPLHLAMINGSEEIIRILQPHYAHHVNISNGNGHTLLHLAVICGNTDMVLWTFANGANAFAADSQGKFPIYYAQKNALRSPRDRNATQIKELLERYMATTAPADVFGYSSN